MARLETVVRSRATVNKNDRDGFVGGWAVVTSIESVDRCPGWLTVVLHRLDGTRAFCRCARGRPECSGLFAFRPQLPLADRTCLIRQSRAVSADLRGCLADKDDCRGVACRMVNAYLSRCRDVMGSGISSKCDSPGGEDGNKTEAGHLPGRYGGRGRDDGSSVISEREDGPDGDAHMHPRAGGPGLAAGTKRLCETSRSGQMSAR
ncbi:hypothetical protein BD309DRAFT_431584 [Dichomitus squalens]|nr:hypothetical protein BD309DRAFT_431584 [Dichomitus squalens]